jgi:hypothetical protein
LNQKQFTEWQNLHSSIFSKFLKINSQKSAILDCATILKDFQKRSSTKFLHYLVLQIVEELFEKFHFLNFGGKKMNFWPTLISPPSWHFLLKFQRNRVQGPKIYKKWHFTKPPHQYRPRLHLLLHYMGFLCLILGSVLTKNCPYEFYTSKLIRKLHCHDTKRAFINTLSAKPEQSLKFTKSQLGGIEW